MYLFNNRDISDKEYSNANYYICKLNEIYLDFIGEDKINFLNFIIK